MEQKYLCALLQLYRSNFQVLHWCVTGKSFDRIHGITNDYYEKVGGDLDAVAEILLRQGIIPDSYFGVIKTLQTQKVDGQITNVSSKAYHADEVLTLCQSMLGQILAAIQKILECECMKDIKNVGIKSFYENLYNDYDHEYRFLNKHRIEE